MKIIGIDPGLDGGIAVMDERGLRYAEVLPTTKLAKKREVNLAALRDLLSIDLDDLNPFARDGVHVFLEHVHAMPKQGVTSMFTFGRGFGQIEGILAGLRIPYTLVSPQTWKKVVMAGEPKGSEILVAERLWPEQDWRASERCKKQHMGMIDAALIAEYGRRLGLRKI